MTTLNHFASRSLFLFTFLFLVFSCDKDDPCKPAPLANAGADQDLVGTTATLAANEPEPGTGAWTIVSGTGGMFADVANPASAFTGTLGSSYVLKWTITGCPVSEDDVEITFSCDPTLVATAGPDQNVAGTSATLAANTPSSGNAAWTIVSGAGGIITSASSPTSTFTGQIGTTYVLRWTIACPESHDDVEIRFNDGNPQLLTVDKTMILNGDIITVTGLNFSSNFNGGSQINCIKTADPLAGQEVFTFILSRTATEITAIMSGTNGGATGVYNLRYSKKSDASPATLFPSNLAVEIIAPAGNQFYTSSSFTSTSATKGLEASFGIKNGSLTPGDYTVKLNRYDYVTGTGTEFTATVTGITAGGFGGTMDKITFAVPADIPSNLYTVKVTHNGKTLAGGWGQFLNVF